MEVAWRWYLESRISSDLDFRHGIMQLCISYVGLKGLTNANPLSMLVDIQKLQKLLNICYTQMVLLFFVILFYVDMLRNFLSLHLVRTLFLWCCYLFLIHLSGLQKRRNTFGAHTFSLVLLFVFNTSFWFTKTA